MSYAASVKLDEPWITNGECSVFQYMYIAIVNYFILTLKLNVEDFPLTPKICLVSTYAT